MLVPTVSCLYDFTYALAKATSAFRENGFEVLSAQDIGNAPEVAAETPVDASLLNCQREKDNSGL